MLRASPEILRVSRFDLHYLGDRVKETSKERGGAEREGEKGQGSELNGRSNRERDRRERVKHAHITTHTVLSCALVTSGFLSSGEGLNWAMTRYF